MSGDTVAGSISWKKFESSFVDFKDLCSKAYTNVIDTIIKVVLKCLWWISETLQWAAKTFNWQKAQESSTKIQGFVFSTIENRKTFWGNKKNAEKVTLYSTLLETLSLKLDTTSTSQKKKELFQSWEKKLSSKEDWGEKAQFCQQKVTESITSPEQKEWQDLQFWCWLKIEDLIEDFQPKLDFWKGCLISLMINVEKTCFETTLSGLTIIDLSGAPINYLKNKIILSYLLPTLNGTGLWSKISNSLPKKKRSAFVESRKSLCSKLLYQNQTTADFLRRCDQLLTPRKFLIS